MATKNRARKLSGRRSIRGNKCWKTSLQTDGHGSLSIVGDSFVPVCENLKRVFFLYEAAKEVEATIGLFGSAFF
jgi:hypothetical protein